MLTREENEMLTRVGPGTPAIPKYDVWVRTDGWHWLRVLPQLDCNWLQAMENSVDTAHLHILNQERVTDGFKVESTTRGTIDNLIKFEVEEFGHGLLKRTRSSALCIRTCRAGKRRRELFFFLVFNTS